jgi:hypothetical protein
MSQKSLDQLGRTGAFHHMIRRKCASSDSGLNNLKDIQAKTLYLPLTEDGMFGKQLFLFIPISNRFSTVRFAKSSKLGTCSNDIDCSLHFIKT